MMSKTQIQVPLKLRQVGDPISHDELFCLFFKHLKIVRAFLVQFIDPELLADLDLDTLEVIDSAFSAKRKRKTFADVVVKCKSKNHDETYHLTFLFEHKSKQPTYPHFQLLDYMHRSYMRDMRQKVAPSFVVPIVVYHGVSPWQYKPMESYFPGISARFYRFMPGFDYFVIDLSVMPIDQLRSVNDSSILRNLLIMLKFALVPSKIKPHLHDIVKINSAQKGDITVQELFDELLEYMLQRVPAKDEAFAYAFVKETTKENEIMTSVSDQLKLSERRKVKEEFAELIAQKELAAQKELIAVQKSAISNLIQAFPDLSDKRVAEIQGVEVALVAQIRASIN